MAPDVSGLALGTRVVVRHRLPEPDALGHTLTDVVGELVGRDADSLTVATRRGEVRVPLATITVVKAIPPRPSRRGAPHRALSVTALQEVMVDAWGALEREWLGRWQLRAGGGYTQRANSVALLGDPGLPLAEAVALSFEWYAARSLPLNVTVAGPVGFAVDQDPVGQELLRRGAQIAERCLTMTADVAAALSALPGDNEGGRAGVDGVDLVSQVLVSDHLSDAWLAAHHGYRSTTPFGARDLKPQVQPDAQLRKFRANAEFPARITSSGSESPRQRGVSESGTWAATARAVLTGSPAQLFATVHADDGEVVALGRAGLTPGWVGLGSIWVDPGQRGRGLARAVSRALLAEALDRGHRWAHLQVFVENAPARALYATMGFVPHHDYVNVIEETTP